MEEHKSEIANPNTDTNPYPKHNGESISKWSDDINFPACPALAENLNVDVCIVGAGIGGLTTAYLLTKL